MGDIVDLNSVSNSEVYNDISEENKDKKDLIETTKGILAEIRVDILTSQSVSMPIAQLATLGAGAASLIPALRTVTQTTSISGQGLYRLANAGINDVLKRQRMVIFGERLKRQKGNQSLHSFKKRVHYQQRIQRLCL